MTIAGIMIRQSSEILASVRTPSARTAGGESERRRASSFYTIPPAVFCGVVLLLATSILLGEQTHAKELKAPVFLERIPNETVPSGRNVRLACVVDHLGNFKVAWIQQDRSAILTVGKHVITRNPRIGVTHDEHRTWYLIIRKVKPGDAGTYMCQINTEPVTSQIGVVNVVVPPYIKDEMTSKDVSLSEGSSVSLTCSARGSPIPTVKWKREKKQRIRVNSTMLEETSGPILHLTHLTRNDMGAYLCIASNGVPPSVSKRIQVQVKFRPSVNAPIQLVGIPVGQEEQLECYVEAWPRGLNYWKNPDGLEILHTDDKYNVSTEKGSQIYKTKMVLTIKNFSTADIGSYNCIANNSQGGAEQVIRVSASPTIVSNPNSLEKGYVNVKEPSLASEKSGLSTDNWSKEGSNEDENATFSKKKSKSQTTFIHPPRDSLHEQHFFSHNPMEERQQSSSASKITPAWVFLYFLIQESLFRVLKGLMSFLFLHDNQRMNNTGSFSPSMDGKELKYIIYPQLLMNVRLVNNLNVSLKNYQNDESVIYVSYINIATLTTFQPLHHFASNLISSNTTESKKQKNKRSYTLIHELSRAHNQS